MGDEATAVESSGVEELARNFDIWDPALNEDPYPVLAELQRGCPVARSERLGGYWFVTSYDGVREVFTNPAAFSSVVLQVPAPENPPVLIPETLDPPTHTAYRHVMSPLFSPHAIGLLEESTRTLARDLIGAFVEHGGGDFVEDVALPLPANVFMSLLGLPWDDLPLMLEFRDALMRGSVSSDPEVAKHAIEVVMPRSAEYFGAAIAERRAIDEPPSDLLTAMVTGHLELDGGRTMTDEEIVNALFLLVSAGLDTVTASIAKSMWTLATRPDLLDQLVDDPTIIPSATEEFLRYWSLVSTCRRATADTTIQDVPVQAGDLVNVCTPAASRDPKEFDAPDEIDFRRAPNRHVAFGAGPHRCIGSHLARMEMRVTLEEVARQMPRFSLDEDDPPVQRFGQVIGCDRLPLRLPS